MSRRIASDADKICPENGTICTTYGRTPLELEEQREAPWIGYWQPRQGALPMEYSNRPIPPSTEEYHRRADLLDSELQADPELAEGSAGAGRIGLFAVAIIAILGVVFFGLNNSATGPTNTASTTQSMPAPSSGPAINAAPGQTTGSAPPPAIRDVTPPSPSAKPAPSQPSNQ